jgi:SHS2 domain-containing protein
MKKRIIYASALSVFGALIMSSFTHSSHSTGNTACEIYGKIKIVDYGEDYKVKIVDYGEDLKVKWVDYGEDSKGKWKKVDYGQKYKIKWVDYGEDFKIKEVTYGEGC